MKARVLHVWNTAGVASDIARFTDSMFDTESKVITRRAADQAGLTTYGRAYDEGAVSFFFRAVRMSRHADLVHVHSLDRVVPWVKRVQGGPVVMHYHGTDIEGRWAEKRGRWSKADFVAVSTPNLLEGAPAGAVYVPNPIDTGLFRDTGGPRSQGSAVSFHYGMDAEAEAAAKGLGLKLDWLERWSVKHEDMPSVLSKYAYYIDMRRPPAHVVARSLGRAALEALACGCSVVDWTGKVTSGLPKEHEAAAVASRWDEIYRALLRQK